VEHGGSLHVIGSRDDFRCNAVTEQFRVGEGANRLHAVAEISPEVGARPRSRKSPCQPDNSDSRAIHQFETSCRFDTRTAAIASGKWPLRFASTRRRDLGRSLPKRFTQPSGYDSGEMLRSVASVITLQS